jgi:hypothetical protein
MSGSGDIDGEVSGEEAAWRDLVARFDTPGQTDVAAAPWPEREDLPAPDAAANSPVSADEPGTPGEWVADPTAPPGRTRVIRFAGDPRSYSPPEEEDEPYVPDPLPPPPRMDAVSKGAWVALIGGPGYLLVGTLAGWTISGTEALAAIAAFVAGCVILVVKMGDRPPRDENDDGAVL